MNCALLRKFVLILAALQLVAVTGAQAIAAEEPNMPAWRNTFLAAESHYAQGLLEQAGEEFAGALTSLESQLTDAEPNSPSRVDEIERNRRRCLFALAHIHRQLGQRELALQYALAYRDALGHSADPAALLDVTLEIAEDRIALREYSGARVVLQRLLDDRERSLKAFPKLRCLVHLATLDDVTGRRETAQQEWTEVRRLANAFLTKQSHLLTPSLHIWCARQLVMACQATGDAAAARHTLQSLLAFHERQPNGVQGKFETFLDLASSAMLRNDWPTSEGLVRQALNECRDTDVEWTARLQVLLGKALKGQQRLEEAKQAEMAAAAAYEKLFEQTGVSGHWSAATGLLKQLLALYQQTGQIDRSVKTARRLYTLCATTLAPNDPRTIDAQQALGSLLATSGDYQSARPHLESVMAYWRRRADKSPMKLASVLNNLAAVKLGAGSPEEARLLFEEVVQLRESCESSDSLDVATSYNNLGSVLVSQGRYAPAIDDYRKALHQCDEAGQRADALRSTTLLNLANAYRSQGQYQRAAEFCRQALELHQAVFGADSFGVASYDNALAALSRVAGRYGEAYRFAKESLRVCARHGREGSAAAAAAHYNLGTVYFLAGVSGSAQDHWQQSFDIYQRIGQVSSMARLANCLGLLAFESDDLDRAEQYFQQALAAQEGACLRPQERYSTLCNLAAVAHQKNKRRQALQWLRQAIDVVETPRASTEGSEMERAGFLERFAPAFDMLVEWSFEAGDVAEAFLAAERSRNRTFLDQLRLAGVDLRTTLEPTSDNIQLLNEDKRLRIQINSLRSRISTVMQLDHGKDRVAALEKQFDDAEQAYTHVWKDIRSRSPYYRNLLTEQSELCSLATFRQEILAPGQLLLFYALGPTRSYVCAIGDASREVKIFPLQIDDQNAAALSEVWQIAKRKAKVEEEAHLRAVRSAREETADDSAEPFPIAPGPLTRHTAAQVVTWYLTRLRGSPRDLSRGLDWEKGPSPVTQGVSRNRRALTAVAEILLPSPLRKLIQERQPDCLMIVPDGALHSLPFEALLLEDEPRNRFLLDYEWFPPIVYAPSANILATLTRRSPADRAARAQLLTVGNPRYSPLPASVDVAKGSVNKQDDQHLVPLHAQTDSRKRIRETFLGLAGPLPLLPATARECKLVRKAFTADGRSAISLMGTQATEANVVKAMKGKGFLHLAAHGLVDEAPENLFGGIALTPPLNATSKTQEDGFLSYHEILRLPLTECELAVLSACQTSVGPERPMEAGSSLAQAFLAAGVRRVVASQWSVADDSTAELISHFFQNITKSLSEGQTIDYASALWKAKQQIRSDPRWQAPFYWAPFILIGPPIEKL